MFYLNPSQLDAVMVPGVTLDTPDTVEKLAPTFTPVVLVNRAGGRLLVGLDPKRPESPADAWRITEALAVEQAPNPPEQAVQILVAAVNEWGADMRRLPQGTPLPDAMHRSRMSLTARALRLLARDNLAPEQVRLVAASILSLSE